MPSCADDGVSVLAPWDCGPFAAAAAAADEEPVEVMGIVGIVLDGGGISETDGLNNVSGAKNLAVVKFVL